MRDCEQPVGGRKAGPGRSRAPQAVSTATRRAQTFACGHIDCVCGVSCENAAIEILSADLILVVVEESLTVGIPINHSFLLPLLPWLKSK